MANKYSSPTPSDKTVGERLRQIRRERKLSQSQIGDVLNVSYQQVQRYENGTARITTDSIQKLAFHLNVPVMYFFAQTEDPEKLASQDILEELILTYLKLTNTKLRTDLLNHAKSLVQAQGLLR